MSKKKHPKQEQRKRVYFLPEYGISVEAENAKAAVALAENQQKGSEESEN